MNIFDPFEPIDPGRKITPLGVTPFDAYRENTDKTAGIYFGEQNVFRFPNGYALSCIKYPGTYGYECDLFEIAIIKDGGFATRKVFGHNDDVIGYLSERDVIDYLERVAKL